MVFLKVGKRESRGDFGKYGEEAPSPIPEALSIRAPRLKSMRFFDPGPYWAGHMQVSLSFPTGDKGKQLVN